MAAVVVLSAVGGSAETVETRVVAVRADTEIVILDASALEAREDVSAEIEHGMPRTRGWRKELLAAWVDLGKAGNEVITNLVILLPDHRPERRDNALAFGAKRFHCAHGGFKDASQCAAPPCMRGADHACIAVGEQHRSAVRRRDPN